jgi:hypothetical protein
MMRMMLMRKQMTRLKRVRLPGEGGPRSSTGRAAGFYPEGWGIVALRGHDGRVTQVAEYPALTREVGGSWPSAPTADVKK